MQTANHIMLFKCEINEVDDVASSDFFLMWLALATTSLADALEREDKEKFHLRQIKSCRK